MGRPQTSVDRMSIEEEHITSRPGYRSRLLPEPQKNFRSYDNSPMSPPSGPEQIQSRPVSFASSSSNRLSLSLLAPAGDRDTRYTPTSSDPPSRQDSPSKEHLPTVLPNESSAFLVALAAQERKVLELKEELHQAESKLSRLKRQWISHDVSRNMERPGVEMSQLEMCQISPITRGAENYGVDEAEDRSVHSAKREVESHRRKAGIGKDSRRKVITGGHTRALSLLSPVIPVHGDSALLPSIFDSVDDDGNFNNNALPQTTQVSSKSNLNKTRHSYQGNATTGMKQIADDIKSGLWTFMEDLRQATVGDEPIKGMSAIGVSPKPSGAGKDDDMGVSVITDQTLNRIDADSKIAARGRESTRFNTAASADPKDCKAQQMAASENSPDNTDSLDDDQSKRVSPLSRGKPGRRSDNIAVSLQNSGSPSSPSNDSKSPKAFPKLEDMQWPVLNSFTPSNIKRTASAIIKDWEKSLVVPIDGQKDSIDSVSDPTTKMVEESETRLPSCAHP